MCRKVQQTGIQKTLVPSACAMLVSPLMASVCPSERKLKSLKPRLTEGACALELSDAGVSWVPPGGLTGRGGIGISYWSRRAQQLAES